MRRYEVVMVAIALLLVSSFSQARIVGKDDRRFLNESGEKAAASVGRVTCTASDGRREFSTFTLFGDQRTLIGAGHFFFNKTTKEQYNLDECRFELTDIEGNAYFSSGLLSAKVGGEGAKGGSVRSITEDWAVIKLRTSVPTSIKPLPIINLGVRDVLQNTTNIFIIGYHNDSLNTMRKQVSPNCHTLLVGDEGKIISHDCDTSPGASGAPLLWKKDGINYLIGLHNSAWDGTSRNLAIPIPGNAIRS